MRGASRLGELAKEHVLGGQKKGVQMYNNGGGGRTMGFHFLVFLVLYALYEYDMTFAWFVLD